MSTHHLPPSNKEWVTNEIYFPGFADLSTPKGKRVQSNKFICSGSEWSVRMYPRGDASAREDMTSMFLVLCSPGRLKVEFYLSFGGSLRLLEYEFNSTSAALASYGWQNLSRELILACLVDGTLMVEVKMRLVDSTPPFIPRNPATCEFVRNLFRDEEFSDIIFEIGEGLFHAHRLVLKKAAPQFEELCLKSEQTPSRIRIPDVSPDTFEAMLLYIYGYGIPEFGKNTSLSKEIILAANKYGVTNLKLEAEAHHVSLIKLNLNNVVENLLFAESNSCALLKETVMNFIVNNAETIVGEKTLNDFPGGLLNDALAVLAIKQKKQQVAGNISDVSKMTISELRRVAHEKGLQVDGTREMLISLLNT